MVIIPGFSANQETNATVHALALAEAGYVAFAIDTKSIFAMGRSRARQLLDALDYLVHASEASHRVDPNRTAVVGVSLGAWGVLKASEWRPSLSASMALVPGTSALGLLFGDRPRGIEVPTLIVGCERDFVVGPNPRRHYDEATAPGTPTAFVQIAGADHGCTNFAPIPSLVVTWANRFLRGDTSVDACPPADASDPAISAAEAKECP